MSEINLLHRVKCKYSTSLYNSCWWLYIYIYRYFFESWWYSWPFTKTPTGPPARSTPPPAKKKCTFVTYPYKAVSVLYGSSSIYKWREKQHMVNILHKLWLTNKHTTTTPKQKWGQRGVTRRPYSAGDYDAHSQKKKATDLNMHISEVSNIAQYCNKKLVIYITIWQNINSVTQSHGSLFEIICLTIMPVLLVHVQNLVNKVS